MSDDRWQQTLLSQQTSELLALTLRQLLHGSVSPSDVTGVLRRACLESRHRPPELLILRLKELWTKVAEGARLTAHERDRRYFALIGECLVLYYAIPATQPVRHASFRDTSRTDDRGGCGEPEAFAAP